MTPEETVAALAAKEQELADAKKSLADKEKELGQAQFTIVDLKKKKEPASPAAQEVDIEAIEEKALSISREEIEKFKVEQSKDTFEDILATFKGTPEEKEKIKTAYNTQIVKTGFNRESIRQDLENAFILANKPKFETTIKELQATAISKGTQSGASASSQEIDKKEEPNLSDAEKAWVKTTAAKRGISEDAVTALLMKNKGR
jgi:hypothetical protein